MLIIHFYKQSPPPSTSAPKASVSDKKKFFEKAMEEHHQPSPKPGKNFVISLLELCDFGNQTEGTGEVCCTCVGFSSLYPILKLT